MSPIYEFECPRHGVFEAYHRITDGVKKDQCPKCHNYSPKIISLGQRPLVDTKGFSPGYKPSLADYPGDPNAMVKTKDECVRKFMAKGFRREDIIFKGDE